ncbi:MAG: hypothetical protein CMP09_16740 [Yangia sp.]|nr:hypothetical protein [Salipiger sp.]
MSVYDDVHLAAALARRVRRLGSFLMAGMLDRNLSRPSIYEMLGKPEASPTPTVQIAEADGTVFEVRETL